ncbi:hypothetical protein [Parasitella parasitica]|uniref:Uncharacterized protein n=1 Tax=Parasitella parasitica TaxID=35722 RepID=A0A0B7NEP6_9FUNG|nr:hypothetical protein [Parasitella parasitica]
MTEDQGASPNEQMLSFCRNDQEEDLIKLFEEKGVLNEDGEGKCDLSYTNGVGNTAAHIAAESGSIGCLETLANEGINLDIRNKLRGETALHLAVKHAVDDPEMAYTMVEFLLECHADPAITDCDGLTPVQRINPKFEAIKSLFHRASIDIDDSDIPNDDEVDDDGSASQSD